MNDFSRIGTRNKAIHKLTEILKTEHKVLIIHYSCESFYEIPEGRSARITSIAVRYFDTGQDKSFSIHKVAELKSIQFDKIEDCYNEIEKALLDDFFDFVSKHKDYFWLHWNMRDINFGFEALNHRYNILGGKCINISNYNKIDLSRLFIDKYGPKYISHPRLEKLIEINKISSQGFLRGIDEADAFNKKNFVELHKSSLKKVDIIHNLLTRSLNNTLKHEGKYKDIYGLSPNGIMEIIKENWIISLVLSFLSMILGALISKLFE